MKKLTKLLALILSAVMVLTSVSFAAFADEPSMKLYAICLTENSSHDIDDEDNYEPEFGDAVLLESGGKYLLMDTGAEYTDKSLIDHLSNFGITELEVYISHLHSDHIGGLAALAENFTITKLYLPDYTTIGTEYENKAGVQIDMITWSVITKRANFEDGLEDSRVVYLKKGSTFSVGSVTAEVLGPVGTHHPSDYEKGASDSTTTKLKRQSHYLNDCSLTTMFTCGNVKFLTTGDIEEGEETALVGKYKSNGKLEADILKMPHHGLTSTSNTEKFFEAVGAKYYFAENMGYGTTVSDKKTVWKNHTAIERAQKYGIAYMVGTEGCPLIIEADGAKAILSKDKNANGVSDDGEAFEGWVEVCGIAQKPEGKDASHPNYTGNNRYYFDENGNLLTGVQKIDGSYYYLGKGGAMENGYYEFNSSNGKWEYRKARTYNNGKELRDFEEDGKMAVGFGNIISNGKTYLCYHEPATGFRKLGSANWDIYDIGGKKYAINASGVIFNNEGAGGLKAYTVNSKTRYRLFDKNGAMQTGFIETISNGKPILCYYQPSDGFRKAGTKNWDIYEIKGKKYAINENGVIFNNNGKGGLKTYTINKKTCYRHFNSKGVMTTGWKDLSGATYYFNPDSGLRETGFKCIDSKYYYFNDYGKLQKSRTITLSGVKCTFDKNGVMTSPKVAKPKNLAVKAKSKAKNVVSWKKVKNASGYYVLRSTSKSGTYKTVKTITKGTTVSFTDTSVKSKKTYYYKVKAYRKISGVKVYGSLTSAKSIKTK